VTLTPDEVVAADVEAVRRAGVADDAIVDALHVCALFNTIDRIADALAFELPPDGYFADAAPGFLAEGYAASAERSRSSASSPSTGSGRENR
jgi:hypothetical protein